MAWKSLVSYWSVLGLASQASRWERAMNAKLLQAATAAEKAAALQASASEHQVVAAEAQEEALAEEAEAASLRKESSLLLEASDKDAALAAAEEAELGVLEAEMAAEEEQVAGHASAAALAEAAAEEAAAEATADASAAARTEAKARGEEIGIGICELVPLLDVACDVIGGVTAVGLEGAAASLAVKASAEAAAAIASQAEEEAEMALVAELQAKAAEDAVGASELQGEEAAEAQAAEEERLAGEQKQAEAEALAEQARAGEELAEEEETLAAQQEEQAASFLQNAVLEGVAACWDAIVASLLGLVSLGYFSVRIVSNAMAPMVAMLLKPGIPGPRKDRKGSSSFGRDASYVAHHVVVFGLSVGMYEDVFQDFQRNSLQARGGLILCFAATGAFLQTLLLHSIPARLSRSQSWAVVVLEGLRFLISLSFLFVLEILILWVACGKTLFNSPWLAALDRWYWWILWLVPYGLHLWCWELVPRAKNGRVDPNTDEKPFYQNADEKPSSQDDVRIAREDDALLPTRVSIQEEPPDSTSTPSAAIAREDDALLPTRVSIKSEPPDSTATPSAVISWCSSLWQDIRGLQIPFEILLFSCMLRVLMHCLSSIAPLWPASKDLLLSTLPDWLLPLAVVLSVSIVSVLIGTAVWNKLGP